MTDADTINLANRIFQHNALTLNAGETIQVCRLFLLKLFQMMIKPLFRKFLCLKLLTNVLICIVILQQKFRMLLNRMDCLELSLQILGWALKLVANLWKHSDKNITFYKFTLVVKADGSKTLML